jgi:diadenosine tetraphosphate (Ap4A) HIT family hydrolase
LGDNDLALYFEDRFPVSPGHLLFVPRRHVATYFEATPEEQHALWELVEEGKLRLDATRRPNGYNIGINVGETAGQTVMHLHIHLIPRYHGDMADPRGCVRHVIPEKGKY